MTNIEKIKEYTVEEMAEFIVGVINEDLLLPCDAEMCILNGNTCQSMCIKGVKGWLESEVE